MPTAHSLPARGAPVYLPAPADLRKGKEAVRDDVRLEGTLLRDIAGIMFEVHLFATAVNPTDEDIAAFQRACAALTNMPEYRAEKRVVKALNIDLQVLKRGAPTFVKVLQSSTYIAGSYNKVVPLAHTMAQDLDNLLNVDTQGRVRVARTKIECINPAFQPMDDAAAAKMDGAYYEAHVRIDPVPGTPELTTAEMLALATEVRRYLHDKYPGYRYMVPVTLVHIDPVHDKGPSAPANGIKHFLNVRVHGGRERFITIANAIDAAIDVANKEHPRFLRVKSIREFIAADFGYGEDVDNGILKETPESIEFDAEMCGARAPLLA